MTETTEFWKNHNYELVLTEDRSPTLRWLASDNQETMHHRGGAYSETQLIYGTPLRDSLREGGRSAVSVGLGLGYNEILTACECLKAGVDAPDFRLLSFESDSFLREHFTGWVQTPETDMVYDRIFEFFEGVRKEDVKQWLKKSLELGFWQLQGALQPQFEVKGVYECVFYDAFSSKTSPHLWAEDFLKDFFGKVCAPRARVSTYACTGALKRALKASGFEVLLPEGFHSKRSRTMGIRVPSSNP